MRLSIFKGIRKEEPICPEESQLEITVHGVDGPVRDKICKFVVAHRSLGNGLIETRFLHMNRVEGFTIDEECRTVSLTSRCHDLLNPGQSLVINYQYLNDAGDGAHILVGNGDDTSYLGDIREEFPMGYLRRYDMEVGITALQEAAEPRRLLKVK